MNKFVRWTVDLGYPIGEVGDRNVIDVLVDNALTDDACYAMAQAYGAGLLAAGAGFGMRDIQFDVRNKATAKALAGRLRSVLGMPLVGNPTDLDNLDDSDNDGNLSPYVTYYWEPASMALTMVRDKDWPTLKLHLRQKLRVFLDKRW